LSSEGLVSPRWSAPQPARFVLELRRQSATKFLNSKLKTQNSKLMSHWWQSAVIYQIYPRSFCDTTGDGVGDLEGIRRHLDHLAWLGVDAIWLSPFFRSPMKDYGYDVADYCDVDPLFGSLADFDRLLAEAHGRGLKVLIDWVPNHTSDEHPWFVESRASRASAKRDWYIWRDGTPERQRLAKGSGGANERAGYRS